MRITVGDLRRAIEGRPDDEVVGLTEEIGDFEDAQVVLKGVENRADTGRPVIVVSVEPFDDDDDDDEGEDDA
jgi:hypothetical protein